MTNKPGFISFLATQFLGAFNDNVSKMLVICYGTSILGANSTQGSTFLSIAAACFILPFLTFSHFAGFLADRYQKKVVMVWTKIAEILIMAIGVILAYHGAVYSLLAVLFFMGAQSAFFSPAKYGFLPETHSPSELPRANGATQLFTFVAIIIGGWLGGALSCLYGTPEKLHLGFLICVGIAILGTLTSFFITPTPRQDKNLKFHFKDPISPHLPTLKEMSQDKLLLTGLLGNTFFWFIGTLAQLVIVPLAKNTLQSGDQMVGFLQAAMGLGIGFGCATAGAIGKKGIPYRLVAPGGIAMGASLILMGFFGQFASMAIIFLFLTGFFGGFYQLPLSTTIQDRSPETVRGRYLAAGNALDCISMLLGSAVLWTLQVSGIGPRGILAIMGAMMLLVVLPIARKLKNS